MCGIVGVWNRDGAFDWDTYDELFSAAENRGQDGFGITLVPDIRKKEILTFKSTKTYSVDKWAVKNWLMDPAPVKGSLIIANFRAQPETEVESSEKNLQPIVCTKEGLILSHNGSVANFVVNKYSDYQTKIDSEVILKSYQTSRNMGKVMEEMVGGFAFLLYDQEVNRLFCVNDFKPLAICCIRGKGVILHSCLDVIESVTRKITDAPRCGMNVWEDWYYHWQDGNTIREIDLDSGMERITTFQPNRYHPVWKPSPKINSESVLVSSSGGIDSGLSAFVMRRLGYRVTLVNFNYGQRGWEAESLASRRLADYMGSEWVGIDLQNIFKGDPSSLIRPTIPIETGTESYIKTTTAWVSNRNAIFLSILASLAEQQILSNKSDRVHLVTGMSNLTEEGFYPDNSEYFVRAFLEMTKYSTLVGDRITYVSVMQQIMKSEEWILGKELDFPFGMTVSCDQPYVNEKKEILLCRQCGSTLLSIWAAEMAGVEDPRQFYDLEGLPVMEKRITKGSKNKVDYADLVRRIKLPSKKDYDRLADLLMGPRN
jgi:queuosine biosynthesis protein QueC